MLVIANIAFIILLITVLYTKAIQAHYSHGSPCQEPMSFSFLDFPSPTTSIFVLIQITFWHPCWWDFKNVAVGISVRNSHSKLPIWLSLKILLSPPPQSPKLSKMRQVATSCPSLIPSWLRLQYPQSMETPSTDTPLSTAPGRLAPPTQAGTAMGDLLRLGFLL